MLKISDLKLGYDGKVIVDIPSYRLSKGEHLLITGNSGSGKTTLLYAIGGLLKPMSGEVQRDGEVGIIFQTLHMVNAVSVLDNVLLSSFMKGKKQNKEHALQLLKALGVDGIAGSKPNEISQGQAQRVAIARAAVNSPELILGDEPTSALDDESADKVIKLLFEVAANSGSTLVISSHDSRIKKYFSKSLNLGAAK